MPINISGGKGMSLIETLLTVALVAFLSGVLALLYVRFLAGDDLDLTANSLVQALHEAQVLARGSFGDSGWGASVATSSITVFEGANFAGRNPARDEIISFPRTISANGLAEIDFSKFYGFPQIAGSITFTNMNGDTASVNVNQKGTVSY